MPNVQHPINLPLWYPSKKTFPSENPCVSLTWLLLRFWAFVSWRRPAIHGNTLRKKASVCLFFFPEVWLYIAWQSPFKFGAWYLFKFLAINLGNSTNLPVIRVIHDWFPDALHTQTDRSTPPQSQQTEIDFLSLYVRKLSGQNIWAFFGMILYYWPRIMPGDPHPVSARFLENSVF